LTNISTIIYGASPFIFIWNNIVMTESLAMCAVTLLAYMTISYLKKPNIFFAYFIGIYIFGLIMLRPAFIYIVVIYLLFWIIRYFTNKSEIKNNIIGSVSMLICIILVLLYSLLIKVNYGNFEITNVSTANKVANIIESGTYVSGDNKNIIDMINNELKGRNYKEDFWSSTYKAINNFEKRDIDQYCSSVYKNDTKRYLFYILQNTLILGEKSVGIRGAFNTQDYSSVKYKTLYFYDNMILPINFMHYI
jgi:4-amino-4-deoxy-L-arabinose transferase-like glycosyltransferase